MNNRHDKKIYDLREAKKKIEAYCAYRERCQKEVLDKLNGWGLIPEVADNILIELIQENYVNEERFATSFARGKFRIKKWGRRKITAELKQRNISDYCIRKALQEIPEEEYKMTMLNLMQQKSNAIRSANPWARKQKVFQYLVNKGYESNLVLDYMDDIDQTTG